MVCPSECIRDCGLEEEPFVTLQLGILDDDEIVVVGDVWAYREGSDSGEKSQCKRAVWSAEKTSKIAIYENGSMAENGSMVIARAGDLLGALKVSNAIAANLPSERWGSPESEIEGIAKAALKSETLRQGVFCLIGLKAPNCVPLQTRICARI